jgi:hypothetical protein
MRTLSIMITVAVIALGAAAFAQQQQEQQGSAGTITGINRLTGTVAIAPTQSGTVGSNAPTSAPAPAEEFKVKDGALLDAVHAGDRVTYGVTDAGGVKTITKLDRQK